MTTKKVVKNNNGQDKTSIKDKFQKDFNEKYEKFIRRLDGSDKIPKIPKKIAYKDGLYKSYINYLHLVMTTRIEIKNRVFSIINTFAIGIVFSFFITAILTYMGIFSVGQTIGGQIIIFNTIEDANNSLLYGIITLILTSIYRDYHALGCERLLNDYLKHIIIVFGYGGEKNDIQY